MLERYRVQCRCPGLKSAVIHVDSECPLLLVRCPNCRTLLLEHKAKQAPLEQTHPNTSHREATSGMLAEDWMAAGSSSKPKKFGQYVILKILGSGTMGKVYLAQDEKTSEQVALKILQKPEEPQVLDYFFREVQVLFQLDHPNIVRLKGQGNSNGYPYLALEYLSGRTLADIIKQGPLTPLVVAKMAYQVLSALEYAADFQIIHRDIKPANIFLTNAGEVKLIDMGLAKAIGDSLNLTNTGQTMGSPYYMPPEQIVDAKRASCQSDIYALGATLYHALSANPPFIEHSRKIQDLFQAKLNDRYISVEERAPGLPPEIVRIVKKAMAHSLERRYVDASAMKQDVALFIKANRN